MKRGWCPTLHEPMQSGDGWLARVKPRLGRLGAGDARALAAAARRYGNGVIELTSRANLQFRGLSLSGVGEFAELVVGLGLAEVDPARERRRHVLACPLGDTQPAAALEASLMADDTMAALPGKFTVVVDCGGTPSMRGVTADISVRIVGDRAWITLDGERRGVGCAPHAVVEVTHRLIHAMLARGHTRMREAPGAKLLATIGPMADPPVPAPRGPAIGPLPGGAFGIGLAFGATDADGLVELADLAGEQTLRLTVWRSVIFPHAPGRAPGKVGMFVDPEDDLVSVSACAGLPGCAQAFLETRDTARRLAGRMRGRSLHVSGCAKGCAHPGPSDVTLVGTADGIDLVWQGRAGDAPAGRGMDVGAVAAMLS